jgi:hypothetical protein
MGIESEEGLRGEMIRGVIREDSLQKRRREGELLRQDLMDALGELTDLPRGELERIAHRVARSHQQEEDTFLSIKQQVVWVSATVLALLGAPLMALWLF